MARSEANRLASESSPYLLQHAHNPVDWYPWGEEAFVRARELDRPVFLSVGYAACHWCHVMERESFEDETTAAFLNQRFVSVKVDREERPDVDGIYMDAVQALTGQGGWPMSVWLTTDGHPFYAGTYFPREPRHGLPSFRQVLEALAEAWTMHRDDIETQGSRVLASIKRVQLLTGRPDPVTEDVLHQAFRSLRSSFDVRWGGFGSAPKFPQPILLEFVLRMAMRGEAAALEMVTTTLDRMAGGGIHDQVGGGFARYSTDEAWHVPHFEKMLYDNAQLARIYTQAWLATRDDYYREVASRSLDYLLREMQHPEGGVFSSQDADAGGVEGSFLTWSWDELLALVGEAVAAAFGATREGNWMEGGSGVNVLWHPRPIPEVAREYGLEPTELAVGIGDAHRVLFAARQGRERPAIDDKVLTAWNGLAIRAFSEAGRAFDHPGYVAAATRCADFLWRDLRRDDGRLLRSWRDGIAGRPGFADDYALLAGGLLSLYETSGDVTWFRRARELADALIDLFADERGGFFQTGRDAEGLVVRPKELQDNAVPSGNSAAAETLLRLALLTGEDRYERAAMSALGLVVELLARAPTGFGLALCAADLAVGPTREVAVIGDPDDPGTRALIDEVVRARFIPNVVLAVAAPRSEATSAVPLLADRPQVGGAPTAYVCERFSCRAPVTTPSALAAQLKA